MIHYKVIRRNVKPFGEKIINGRKASGDSVRTHRKGDFLVLFRDRSGITVYGCTNLLP